MYFLTLLDYLTNFWIEGGRKLMIAIARITPAAMCNISFSMIFWSFFLIVKMSYQFSVSACQIKSKENNEMKKLCCALKLYYRNVVGVSDRIVNKL